MDQLNYIEKHQIFMVTIVFDKQIKYDISGTHQSGNVFVTMFPTNMIYNCTYFLGLKIKYQKSIVEFQTLHIEILIEYIHSNYNWIYFATCKYYGSFCNNLQSWVCRQLLRQLVNDA